jgi:hypothetical protein
LVEQKSLRPGWNHAIQGVRVVKIFLPTPPEPSPRSVTEDPEESKVAEPKKSDIAGNPAFKAAKALM